FCGERERDGLRVAIKLAHKSEPTAAARLFHEAEALAVIGPPHVPAVYETRQLLDGIPYMVMEFLDAPTLAHLMVRDGEMTRAGFEPVALAILDALHVAHERGFVHRDLKPENIFVFDQPVMVKLVDFGLVKDTARLQESTLTGMSAIGTAHYMSP